MTRHVGRIRLLVAVLASGATLLLSNTAPSASMDTDVATQLNEVTIHQIAFAEIPLDSVCGECQNTPLADFHRFFDTDCEPEEGYCKKCEANSNGQSSEGEHKCHWEQVENACSYNHDECPPPPEALIASLRATADDAAAVAQVLQASQGRLVFNADRRAIQARVCGRTVLVHIPLSVQVAEALNGVAGATGARG